MSSLRNLLPDLPVILVLAAVNLLSVADAALGFSLNLINTLYNQFGLFAVCGVFLLLAYYSSPRWGRRATSVIAALNIALSVFSMLEWGDFSTVGAVATNTIILTYNFNRFSKKIIGGEDSLHQMIVKLNERISELEEKIKALEGRGGEEGSRVSTSFDIEI